MNSRIFFLIFVAEAVSVAGQICFKKGVNGIRLESFGGLGKYFSFLGWVLRTPWIWFGLLAMTGWVALWLTVLADAELTLAFPIESIQYLMIIVASYHFLKEPISWMRVVGTLLIILGIALVPLG